MSDLIRNMHNSNSQQTRESLDGDELEENRWSSLGFVSIDVLDVEPFAWRLSLFREVRERVYEELCERDAKND